MWSHTYRLKTSSESEMYLSISSVFGVDDNGELNLLSDRHEVVILGTLYHPREKESEKLIALDGFHANVRSRQEIKALEPFSIFPQTPLVDFA